ncbi:MAG: hypothetical protein EA366_10015 [Spirulina sp. DLM2.Bin59]|nr:MAG: hypothetical protein EA366_10015 [Spirulina sp. DLM2.Bin59]
MYGLDVNFLKDRAIAASPGAVAKAKAPTRKVTLTELVPLIGGVAGGLLVVAIAGGWWGYQQLQIQQINEQLIVLDGQITALQQQNQRIQQLNTEIEVARRQTNGLAQVFARIFPWSAIIEDVRVRIPTGLQLRSFRVSEADGAAAQPNPDGTMPSTMPSVTLDGYADSYGAVNVFSVSLQRSAFFDGNTVRITEAEQIADPHTITAATTADGEGGGNVTIDLPQVVRYSITGNIRDLTTLSSDELITQLRNKQNLGSVIRLETLRERGLLDQ